MELSLSCNYRKNTTGSAVPCSDEERTDKQCDSVLSIFTEVQDCKAHGNLVKGTHCNLPPLFQCFFISESKIKTVSCNVNFSLYIKKRNLTSKFSTQRKGFDIS